MLFSCEEEKGLIVKDPLYTLSSSLKDLPFHMFKFVL